MTTTMQGEGPAREIMISCDSLGCDQSRTSTVIALGGGLREMGWTTRFDDATRRLEHYCPAHQGEAE